MSDARVPGIACFGRGGAQTLAEPFQTVGHRHVGDKFHALVAELAGGKLGDRRDVPYILRVGQL